MRIKVINPNTTLAMTRKIGKAARNVAAHGTEVVAVSPAMGPVSIEGHYDEAISVIGLLDEVRKGEAEGVDGYVIACFGDPGLLAAREVANAPVVGIAEAAMHYASLIATGFSVVEYVNGNIAGALANYTGLYRHKFNRTCEGLTGGSVTGACS